MRKEDEDQTKVELESTSELLIIDNILDLKDLKAMDIMMPRADIIALQEKDTTKNILDIIKNNPYNIYPVYNKSLDEVIGVVRANRVFLQMLDSKRARLTDILEKCLFVSPSISVLDLFLKMKKESMTIAIVVDEFGGVDGLVSITDIIEEIVGEIKGVSKESVSFDIKANKIGDVTVDARTPLDDFEEQTNISLTKEEDIDTIGGVIFDEIGRIPVKGEIITLENGIEIEVIEANPRTIKTVKIHKIDEHIE